MREELLSVALKKISCAGTIDERIVTRAQNKRRLEKLIIRDGRFMEGSMANVRLVLIRFRLIMCRVAVGVEQTEGSRVGGGARGVVRTR